MCFPEKDSVSVHTKSSASCKRTARLAACLLLYVCVFWISLTGCSSAGTEKISWKTADFTCHASFSPYEADFKRTDGALTMTVTEPDNLAGLQIVSTPEGKYTVYVGDMSIPLSGNMAAGLGDFPGVFAGVAGKVETDNNGCPCTLYTTSGGKERVVVITEYTVLTDPAEETSEQP